MSEGTGFSGSIFAWSPLNNRRIYTFIFFVPINPAETFQIFGKISAYVIMKKLSEVYLLSWEYTNIEALFFLSFSCYLFYSFSLFLIYKVGTGGV
jgi:hypothetical protein